MARARGDIIGVRVVIFVAMTRFELHAPENSAHVFSNLSEHLDTGDGVEFEDAEVFAFCSAGCKSKFVATMRRERT